MVEVFTDLTKEYKEMLFKRFSPISVEVELDKTEARLIIFFSGEDKRKEHAPDLLFITSGHFSNFKCLIETGDYIIISFRLNAQTNSYALNSTEFGWKR